jgi:hypothetical protein
MTNIATDRSLLDALNAYARRFSIDNSHGEIIAIASSILTFQQKQGNIEIAPEDANKLIQRVVSEFKVEEVSSSIIDETTDALVQEVNQWKQSLENHVLNSLNAFTQNFQPNQAIDLSETILSILPLVESAQLRKSEAEFLIEQVKAKFNLQTALEHVIDPASLAIAEQLAQSLQFANLEELLKTSLLDNQTLLNQPLENLTESLVNSELKKLLGSNALEVNIDLDAQQLMVKQVTLKLNVMQSAAAPSKSAEEISTQMDSEIERFKVSRSISINFQ